VIFAGELERSGRVERRLQTPAAFLTALSTVLALRLGAIAYSGSSQRQRNVCGVEREPHISSFCDDSIGLSVHCQCDGRQNGGLEAYHPDRDLVRWATRSDLGAPAMAANVLHRTDDLGRCTVTRARCKVSETVVWSQVGRTKARVCLQLPIYLSCPNAPRAQGANVCRNPALRPARTTAGTDSASLLGIPPRQPLRKETRSAPTAL
jgi:hypothetical protein